MRIPTITTLFAALVLAACSGSQTTQTETLGSGSSTGSRGNPASPSNSPTPSDPSTPSNPSTPSTPAPDPSGGQTSGTPTGTGTGSGTATPPSTLDLTTAATTYQAPANVTTHAVASSNSGGTPSVSSYSYTVLPASGTWGALQTVNYPIVDLSSADQLSSGTFTDTNGVSRQGYKFTIAPGQTPQWGGSPRVEFDSATGPDQNPGNGLANSSGWAAGLITPGMEMWFSWSMYLDANFSLTQPWCTLFQLHAGNTNLDPSSPKNGYPNPGWPGVIVEKGTIAFGLGPDANYPGQVWTGKLSDLRGKWTDLAIHAKFSTGSDGLLEFYVNGTKVGSKAGANMVYGTFPGMQPWYYAKQGYYRDPSVSTTDSVYMTPMLASLNNG